MAVSVSELYDALVEAGAQKDQARRAAEAVISRHEAEHQLATKADLAGTTAALKADLAGTSAALKADLASTTAALKGEIASTAAALRGEIADVRTEMLTMKAEIIKWNVGTILAAVGLAVAIVKLMGA